MTDKYEEFKKWIKKMEKESIAVHSIDWEKLFTTFEEEQTEKQKKEEILDLIMTTLYDTTITLEYMVGETNPAKAIYDLLKEKDLIK